MRINKKEMISKKAGISYFEILLLILGSFSFAYIVYESSKEIEKALNENKEMIEQLKQERQKNSLLLRIAKAWLERSRLNLVSAQANLNIALNCCPKLKSGSTCQEVLNVNCENECSEACVPTKCSETSACKIGCCINEKEGLCSNSATQQQCKEGGIWKDDKNCNLEECRAGCCVLGTNAQFVTEKRCEKLSKFYSLELDFRQNVDTEIGCLALSSQQEEGACVIEVENDAGEIERGCKFTTKENCIKLTGNSFYFHENYLCSNKELKTNCERQKSTGCLENKDEVYWFDSCNNRENIYSSDKEKSWNNGKVLKKEESCNAGEGNAGSKDCGNCNYFLGSICGKGKAEIGNYVCKSLDCKNAPAHAGKKQDRKNGESWCVYDGRIGDGKDVPGSRHWKYYCIDGQVKVEPCGDYRNGLCVEDRVKVRDKEMSYAACRPNRAMECNSYNAEENKDEGIKKCKENSDCRILNMNFGKKYEFSVCAPKYPQGFDLSENSEAARQLCKQADFTCTKIKTKKLSGWKNVAGEYCDSIEFTKQMQDWCASLGDCGLQVNIAGEVTDSGYSVSNAPRINAGEYKKYSQSVDGQKVEPGDFSNLFAAYYGWGAGGVGGEVDKEKIVKDALKDVIGISSYAMLTPFIGLALSTLIIASAGLLVSKLFGVKDPSMAILIGGVGLAIISAVTVNVAILGLKAGLGLCATVAGCVAGIVIIIIAIIIFATLKFMKIGKVKKKVIEFKCQPWQAPRGGNDCEKCNNELVKDGLRKCSKYRCESLGQTCEFINEGTGKELCVDISPYDISSPKISPWYGLISKGFKYDEANEEGFKIIGENGECLTEFTPVIFGITTNEPSQCKMDSLHTQGYDEMEFYFGDDNLYLYNHTMAFNMPSMESLLQGMEDELNETELESLKSISATNLGNLTYFVRCIDKKGNSNLKEYLIGTCVKPGPDLTPPNVVKSEPETDSYLAYNQTQAGLKIYVNEPSSCRHEKEDTSYELMNKSFECLTEFEDAELYGWACNTTLTDLVAGENNIYIKCKDQPWLPEENKSRNAMQESFTLTLKASESELKIEKIEPSTAIIVGIEPTSITLRAYTEGGVNSKADCEYSFTNSSFIQFFNTFSSVHEQVLSMMIAGEYNVYVKCKDIAGNKAEGKTSFKIEVDKQAPKILRAYVSSGMLKITTDEDSECAYDFKTCNFVWNNGTKMTGLLKEHTTAGEKGKKYNVKCKDIWDNKPDSCFIVKIY